MGRPKRVTAGGLAYHVLNRGNGRMTLFEDADDYAAFERVLAEAVQRTGMRLCAYCVMPNHWHLVVWPRRDGELSEFVGWLTLTHTQRWHAHRGTAGGGHVYQGRFKSFPIERDDHFLTVCRYVERNALRAGLVEAGSGGSGGRAEDWPWSSLWLSTYGAPADGEAPELSDWPVDRPRGWAARVNRPQTDAELAALRRSVERGCPFGGAAWVKRTASRLGLDTTLRPRGRPRKAKRG